MKMIIKYLGAVALSAVMFTACGKGSSVPEDTSAFTDAITAYLENESMGMKVAEYESVEEQGDKASAVVRLQDAEGITNVKMKWLFDFTRSDGQEGWLVASARSVD